GPFGLPIVGNLFQLPGSDSMKHFATWKTHYGPISSFRIFFRTFVVVNDFRVAVDIFERRSSIHSSRPEL
ncbi:uncharacterized protein FOMMEDRAFT_57915, partial [Fomitiporia mediterranea MF3/22]|uniref:uncharacterized protein n=1 Tax=Fomitiporia mediterranea (strain MF3/22) TaxID=694068 RepID=UPI00044084EB